MSDAIGDIMKAEFTLLRDADGSCVLPPGGASIEDWERQTFLSSGSLIAHSCAAALSLAEHPKRLRDAAFEFGKQIAFAHQVRQVYVILLVFIV